MNNNKKEELKNIKDNKEKNINNTFVICYTESINTLEDKSSTSKEKDNIIILDKSIKKNRTQIKKNKDNSLIKNIIKYMKKEEKNKNIPKFSNS